MDNKLALKNKYSKEELQTLYDEMGVKNLVSYLSVTKVTLLKALKYYEIPLHTRQQENEIYRRNGTFKCNNGGDYFWVTNGLEEKQVSNNSDIPIGYVRGRLNKWSDDQKAKASNSHKGHTGYWQGKTMPISSSELKSKKMKSFYNSGNAIWNKGLSYSLPANMGKVPWNKGIHYRLSESSKKQMLEKQYLTKSKNHTFNISKGEDWFYSYLLLLYDENDIVRQYKDDRYPFNSDFYIKSEDLFIELNRCWTHGEKPFDPNDNSCIEIPSKWKEKAEREKRSDSD